MPKKRLPNALVDWEAHTSLVLRVERLESAVLTLSTSLLEYLNGHTGWMDTLAAWYEALQTALTAVPSPEPAPEPPTEPAPILLPAPEP